MSAARSMRPGLVRPVGMGGTSSASSRSAGIAAHSRPLVCRTRNAIEDAVACSAALTSTPLVCSPPSSMTRTIPPVASRRTVASTPSAIVFTAPGRTGPRPVVPDRCPIRWVGPTVRGGAATAAPPRRTTTPLPGPVGRSGRVHAIQARTPQPASDRHRHRAERGHRLGECINDGQQWPLRGGAIVAPAPEPTLIS
jgi:hypothetical protein